MQGRLSVTVLSVMRELAGQVAERGATLWVSSLPPRALEQPRALPDWPQEVAEGRFHRTADAAVAAFLGADRHDVTDESPPPVASPPVGREDRPS